ncbi:PglZ domain-containing protein [Limibacter armeniacum]|uniref:T9SS response regulator signal transducer PorX n=1 Tax=Limibacter armeniacum TaxID=466084 RepID=UPI002FE560F0
MNRYSILWADDEIDLLKPHILFLQKKGYDVTPVISGTDALDKCQEESFDIIFLDENMPGMTGLETLEEIKQVRPSIPVVMITKSEEEYIMEEAIGSKIADYLIKPINPNQVLLSVKKLLDKKRLVTEKTNHSYQRDFQNISMAFGDRLDHEDWIEIYKKLVYWDLEINQTENKSMMDVLEMQKSEANNNFADFIEDNYKYWLSGEEEGPLLSHQLMKEKVFPLLKQDDKPVFFILIDNLRLDQWKVLESTFTEYFVKEEESAYYSILPTTTAYARNAIFSGMMPLDMKKHYPNLWVDEDSEDGKNNNEFEFLQEQLSRNKFNIKSSYNKVIHVHQGRQVLDNLHSLLNNKLNVIVYNFVDMLSHARTDTEMVRELAPDEAAYRSLTHSWFLHSPLLETLKMLAEKDVHVIVTTDHGTVRVKRPHKIIGDRNTNTNLRYKQGKNLSYDRKNVLAVAKPEEYMLPKVNVSTSYAFATEDYFFAYPNNYNHYVKYYKDTFQHGGISLEEVIIPYIQLRSK